MFPYPKNTAFSTYTFGRLAKPQTYDLASYTFGSIMVSVSKGEYRYGMNTQEKDNEIYGEGNSYSAEYWQYDARLGRRWNVDPYVVKHPYNSPYLCFNNNPNFYVDIKGNEFEEGSKKDAEELL
jgi:PKD repeat protein